MYKYRQKCHVNGSSETSEVQMPKIPLPGAERSIAKATDASHMFRSDLRLLIFKGSALPADMFFFYGEAGWLDSS